VLVALREDHELEVGVGRSVVVELPLSARAVALVGRLGVLGEDLGRDRQRAERGAVAERVDRDAADADRRGAPWSRLPTAAACADGTSSAGRVTSWSAN
jgi:hypothetical protein